MSTPNDGDDDIEDQLGSLLYQVSLFAGFSTILDSLSTSNEEFVEMVDDYVEEHGDPLLMALQASELCLSEYSDHNCKLITILCDHVAKLFFKLEEFEDFPWKSECEKNLHIFLQILDTRPTDMGQKILAKMMQNNDLLAKVIDMRLDQVNKTCGILKKTPSVQYEEGKFKELQANLQQFGKQLDKQLDSKDKGKWSKIFEMRRHLKNTQHWTAEMEDTHKGLAFSHPDVCNWILTFQCLIAEIDQKIQCY